MCTIGTYSLNGRAKEAKTHILFWEAMSFRGTILLCFLQYKKYKQDITDLKRRVFTLVNAVDAVSIVDDFM